MSRILFSYAILLFNLLPVTSLAFAGDDPFRGPWKAAPASQERKADPLTEEKALSQSIFQKLAAKGLMFFQEVISPTDGDRCAMAPSCSTFGLQAVKKHGFVLGTIMTTARLIHEREEVKYSLKIKTDNGYRFYDPVGNNDFWLSPPPDRRPEP